MNFRETAGVRQREGVGVAFRQGGWDSLSEQWSVSRGFGNDQGLPERDVFQAEGMIRAKSLRSAWARGL